MREYLYRICFLLMVILAVSLALPSKAFAQSDSDLTPAEQWVEEQVALGRVADLEAQFPKKEDRVLGADFLVKLLEDPAIEITRYGIRIQNAVFDDPLQLAYIEVDHQIWLEDCEFNGDVNLYESHFTRDIYFRGSTFSSAMDLRFLEVGGNLVADNAKFSDEAQTANFNSMKVDGLVSLRGAEFAGAVDFIAARIGGTFAANEAHFNSTEQPVSFNSMKVDGHIFLHGAEFAGPVDFIGAYVVGNLEADDAHFNNTEKPASFNSMKVDGLVSLRVAEFSGPVDFIRAQIGSSLVGIEAKFTSTEQPASFNSMIVGGSVLLSEAEFAGPVDFIGAQIGGSLEANEAKFTNTEKLASFNSMTVGGIVFLHEAEFAGPVDFILANVGSNLEADGARFNNKNKEQTVNFESMKVDGNIFLNRVVFAGPVSFKFVEIKNNFEANNAEFLSTDTDSEPSFDNMIVNMRASDCAVPASDNEPSFNNMIVRQEASFVGTTFMQGANFDNAVFLDLTIHGVDSNISNISDLRLSQTVVERKLDLESLEIQNLCSRSLVVHGLTNIRNVNILDSADFENSQFGDLQVDNVDWPEGLRNIKLGGMSYQNIRIILEGNEESLNELIDLVDRSAYNAQAYTTLENYFLQQGYADMADEVYIRYKLREFKERLSPSSMGWWSNRFLWFVGYGRQPGFVLIGALLFILIGWLLVFRKPEGMVSLSKREILRPNVGNRGTLSRKISKRVIFSQYEGPYSPFWYSLDLFIPFVDLGYDDKWAPRPNRKLAIAYAKLHMLAGWVLIPIGLLAITGVIK